MNFKSEWLNISGRGLTGNRILAETSDKSWTIYLFAGKWVFKRWTKVLLSLFCSFSHVFSVESKTKDRSSESVPHTIVFNRYERMKAVQFQFVSDTFITVLRSIHRKVSGRLYCRLTTLRRILEDTISMRVSRTSIENRWPPSENWSLAFWYEWLSICQIFSCPATVSLKIGVYNS